MTDTTGYTKILDNLKVIISEKKLTISQIARKVGVSETTLKRGLSTGQLSLERLEKICTALEIQLHQVIQQQNASKRDTKGDTQTPLDTGFYEFTEEQEKFFVKKPSYLTYFYSLHYHNDLDRLKKDFALTDKECDKFLESVAKIELIHLDEDGGIEIPFTGEIVWIEGGLLEQTFFPKAQDEFLNSDFESKNEHFYFQSMELSPKSAQKFFAELQQLIDKYENLSSIESEASVTFPEFGVLIALRPWTFSIFRRTNRGHLEYVEDEKENKSA